MCLTAKKNWFQRRLGFKFRPKTTKKDIHVYKMLRIAYVGPGKTILMSPFRGAPYEVNQLYKAKLDIDDWGGHTVRVEAGLHAFTDYDKAITTTNSFGELILYSAIIPKGSEYIIGDDGDIVSNKLIVKSIIK